MVYMYNQPEPNFLGQNMGSNVHQPEPNFWGPNMGSNVQGKKNIYGGPVKIFSVSK